MRLVKTILFNSCLVLLVWTVAAWASIIVGSLMILHRLGKV